MFYFSSQGEIDLDLSVRGFIKVLRRGRSNALRSLLCCETIIITKWILIMDINKK